MNNYHGTRFFFATPGSGAGTVGNSFGGDTPPLTATYLLFRIPLQNVFGFPRLTSYLLINFIYIISILITPTQLLISYQ